MDPAERSSLHALAHFVSTCVLADPLVLVIPVEVSREKSIIIVRHDDAVCIVVRCAVKEPSFVHMIAMGTRTQVRMCSLHTLTSDISFTPCSVEFLKLHSFALHPLRPAMSAKGLFDGRIEQICIVSDFERMKSEAVKFKELHAVSTTESEDTLSAKTKKQRFEEQSWDSLKSSPFYDVILERKDVLPEGIPNLPRRAKPNSY
ncbi:hypothetical protein F441_05894 [Phytophthora nicotianae CJ01A1]|uniref:Uncharacterized protein n=1 Tax=Phytophthora nicotianae CJ01A1 TaxID=1317063 RepID=W2XBZ0_PHYNI|nr:hypothetical protein F441_05894 [Phytophthora nicotianae CJ01A1]